MNPEDWIGKEQRIEFNPHSTGWLDGQNITDVMRMMCERAGIPYLPFNDMALNAMLENRNLLKEMGYE